MRTRGSPGALGAVVASVNVGLRVGQKKTPVAEAVLEEGVGVTGDAHCRTQRQVSLLAYESIEKMVSMGLDVGAGDFAENITTKNVLLHELPVGTRLALGEGPIVEITSIGKACHRRCEIFRKAGHCIMPREGVFAKVIRGGKIRPGDTVRILGRASRR